MADETVLSDGISPVMPVEQCGFVRQCQSSPQGYASRMGSIYSSATPSAKSVAAHALRCLEEARAKDVAANQRNIPAMANNLVLRDHIASIMVAAGIPASYSEIDRKSRARFPKRVTHDAGYFGDLRRSVVVEDGFAFATSTYTEMKKRYDAYAAEAEGEAARIAAAKIAEQEKRKAARRANVELATIVIRYGLDPEIEWEDVLDALRSKDQRIDLAVAMQQTRCDWSDGPYRVSDALARFKIETDEDKFIANDIVSHLSDWDGDGRVFRDTAWSYDRLFASVVDRQLVDDTLLALERAE